MTDDREHRVRDSICDRCNGKEPHREQGEPVSPLQVHRRQDPDAHPDQIEGQEEVLRPRREAQQCRKPVLKPGDKFLREMETLHRQPEQKEAHRSLPGDQIAGWRLA